MLHLKHNINFNLVIIYIYLFLFLYEPFKYFDFAANIATNCNNHHIDNRALI